MQKVLLNTLYLVQPEGYLRLDHDTVRYEREGALVARIPMHHLSGIVLSAHVVLSPDLLRACGERGIQVTWLDRIGRFAGALRGPTRGNVLLRLAQFRAYVDREASLEVAKSFVRGKVQNSRHTLARRERDAAAHEKEDIRHAKSELDRLLKVMDKSQEHSVLRGYEGQAARAYFSAFPSIFSSLDETFTFEGRTKRPPRDPTNALLSYAYTLATHDCRAALDGVGLDPQVGFLHEVRPGRPALALDLVEELRPSFVDRLVFALVNRRQVSKDSFVYRAGGAVLLSDDGRRTFLQAYQKKKESLVPHPLFAEKIPFGLVPHVQARLLARFLRGDLECYTPFLYR